MQIMTRSENQQNPRESSGWKMITMEQLRRIELIVLPLLPQTYFGSCRRQHEKPFNF